MLYVHEAENHRRDLPAAVIEARQVESDPDRRIVRGAPDAVALPARSSAVVAANATLATKILQFKLVNGWR